MDLSLNKIFLNILDNFIFIFYNIFKFSILTKPSGLSKSKFCLFLLGYIH